MHGEVKCVTNLVGKSQVKTAVRSTELIREGSTKMEFNP